MSDSGKRSVVAVLKTSPDTVIADYKRLLLLAEYSKFVGRSEDTIIKLNLSWTRYFPACSSQPWQVEGTIKALLGEGFDRSKLFPLENRTVVTGSAKRRSQQQVAARA